MITFSLRHCWESAIGRRLGASSARVGSSHQPAGLACFALAMLAATISTAASCDGGYDTRIEGLEASCYVSFEGDAPSNLSVGLIESGPGDVLYAILIDIGTFNQSQIWRVDPNGSKTLLVQSASLLTGLAVDPSGAIYYHDANGGVLRRRDAGGSTSTIANGIPQMLDAVYFGGRLFYCAFQNFEIRALTVAAPADDAVYASLPGVDVRDISADAAGTLFVASSAGIQKITAPGTVELLTPDGREGMAYLPAENKLLTYRTGLRTVDMTGTTEIIAAIPSGAFVDARRTCGVLGDGTFLAGGGGNRTITSFRMSPLRPDRRFGQTIDPTAGVNNYGWGAWSWNGAHIAFAGSGGAVYVVEPGGTPQQVNSVHLANDSLLLDFVRPTWTPDSKSVVFASASGDLAYARVDGSGEGILLDMPVTVGMPAYSVASSATGTYLAFVGNNGEIYAASVHVDGSPLGTPVLIGQFTNSIVLLPAWSPAGPELLFSYIPITETTSMRTFYFNNAHALVEGPGGPITSFSDSRLTRVRGSNRITGAASFSSDGSLILFCEEISGTANAATNILLGDYDLFVQETDRPGLYQRISPSPAHETIPLLSPDGTKVLWASCAGTSCDLRLSNILSDQDVSGNLSGGMLQEEVAIADGSGSALTIASGTTITFPPASQENITIETPLIFEADPDDLAAAGSGVLILARDFGPDGTTFNPPAVLTMRYTDAEVAGIDESTLRVFEFNPATGALVRELPVVPGSRNLAENSLAVIVEHFSLFGIAGSPIAADSDGDGIPDDAETNTGIFVDANDTGTDPNNPDTDGDGLSDGDEVLIYGTDPNLRDTDGDGVDDDVEISLGYDPLNPNEFPEMPAVSIGFLLVLILLLAYAAAAILQSNRRIAL